ncbi:MAG: TlpA family protein disulfide reductase [Desulfobacula sp.]|nr:TlpA family protein disulfide reductase [Desulfobacula sp.]
MKKLSLIVLVFFLPWLIFACGYGPTLLKTGDPAPDFSLVDRQGKTWTLSELKGEVVFINFWATWCPPCLKELPSMERLYTALPKDKFKMVAILNKDKITLADFVASQKGITIPILDDSKNIAGASYFLTGLPETFIIDKQGTLVEKFIGPAQWDAPQYFQMIMKYINQ